MHYSTHLQLFEGEASTIAHFSVVLKGGTSYDRPQETVGRTGGNSSCLFETLCSSGLLLTRLVEPSSNKTLPVLLKMAIRDYSIPHRSHDI